MIQPRLAHPARRSPIGRGLVWSGRGGRPKGGAGLGSTLTLLVLPLLLLAPLLLLLTACTKAPAGPPFTRAADPPEHRGRLYLYRTDERSSASRVRIEVNGLEIGTFRDREYETLELPAGTHHVRAGMRSLGLVAWGWNDQRIRLKPGETVFVEISVRLMARETPGGRGLEIAGRPEASASENVFLQQRAASEALSRIAATTRLTAR